MRILKALIPFFIILPGCLKKREISTTPSLMIREVLDLPDDEDLENDTDLPECGEEAE